MRVQNATRPTVGERLLPVERRHQPKPSAVKNVCQPSANQYRSIDTYDYQSYVRQPTVTFAHGDKNAKQKRRSNSIGLTERSRDRMFTSREMDNGDNDNVSPFDKEAVSHNVQHHNARNYRRSLSADRANVVTAPDAVFARPRPVDNSIAVPRYDGTGDLELFLKRFFSVSRYYRWTQDEQLFRLEHCLTDDAQYVLMDAPTTNNIEEFVRILRSRFGLVTNAEQHRSELSRLRRGSKTIQELYLVVRRLVNKAFPGEWTTLTEIYARDAFLNALDDSDLRRRIIMTVPPPETLAEAYDLAVRALAVDESSGNQHFIAAHENHRSRRGQLQARVIKEADTDSEKEKKQQEELASLKKQVFELQAALARATVTSLATSTQPEKSHAAPAAIASRDDEPRPRNVCWKCNQPGHWARNCRVKTARSTAMNMNSETSHANILTSQQRKQIRTYMEIIYQGHRYKVLLDTGCDVSILSSRVLPNLTYQQSQHRIFAANWTPVSVLGTAVVDYTVAGIRMQNEFLVSDEIEEIVFGADWLTASRCLWDFIDGVLWIRTMSEPTQVQLKSDGPKRCIRRIYARETVELKPFSQTNVAVKSVWSTLPSMNSDWLVEPKELHSGVIMARTLLPSDGGAAFIRVVNCSPTTYALNEGELLTQAEAVDKLPPPNQLLEHQTVSVSNCGGQPSTDDNCDHVKGLIDELPEELTADQRCQAAEFIRSYAHIFSRNATDLGRNSMLPHRINTGDHPPIRQPLRRQPYAHQAEIERNVQEMLAAKVIEPAQSPWQSNVLLVPKRDNTFRFTVDYRSVNNITVKDSYALPRIDACLDSLGGSEYFSTLDLRAGYWQTELASEDADKTAFCTRSGQYKFVVLSMGLCNAPSQFQRLMDLVLAGLTYESCLVFLDDIICFSRSFEEHLKRLGTIFERLAQANLKLRASKCQLFKTKVRFLGYIVSSAGIATDPEKIRVVANWPTPRNLHEVRSFLGLSGYYRKHVYGYADTAKALHMLTNKQQPFVWGPAQEAAFQKLKHQLISAPVLAAPQDEGKYVLDTDASLVGLGAVLQQQQGSELRVIAYASRCLSRAEQNYSTTRHELLAVVYGFKQFRQFLLGRHFLLRVDHSALTYLRKTPEPIGQAARWLNYIEEYNFDILHRSGQSHGNCDALSRHPWHETWEDSSIDSVTQCLRLRQPESAPKEEIELTPEIIAAEQRKDVSMSVIITALQQAQERPSWVEIQAEVDDARVLWAQYASLSIKDNLLQRSYYSPDGAIHHWQIVMPASLRQVFLQNLHESHHNVGTAHLGVKKTLAHVSQRAYWPSWRTDTERYCRQCAVCQTVQHGIAPRHGEMKPYAASGIGDRLHIDLTGPHPSSRQGSVYILTAIDAFSRFLFCVPLKNKNALTVATALVEHVFLPHGSYRSMVSDQGREFCNEVLDSVAKLLGIQKLRTTTYRPSANGRVERVHRTLNGLLSKIISENQKDWQDRLPMVTAAYNAAQHESTSYSPYYLMYGREYRTPLDLTLQAPSPSYGHTEIDYVDNLRDRMKDAFEAVNDKLKTGTQRMKMRYDAKVKAIQLEPDDWVLYYIPQRKVGRNQKWRRLCKIGRVVQRFNDVLYSIKLGPRAAPIIAHVDRLRRYEGSPPEQWRLSVGQPNRQPSAFERNCQQQSNLITQPESSIRRQGVAIERPAAAADAEEGLKRGTPLATTASSPANKRVMSTTPTAEIQNTVDITVDNARAAPDIVHRAPLH
jgi:transposase InsO family protein/predicted aspartyl protease